jgi:serine/threonine protein phosphatase 1
MRSLFSRWRGRDAGTAQLPAGQRVIAIGDIHGRLDLFEELLERLTEEDVLDSPGVTCTLIGLGDYVDRGPDSARLLDRLIALQASGLNTVFLLGNHEDILLAALDGTAEDGAIRSWLRFGGRETMASYRLPSAMVWGDDMAAIQQALRAAVPPEHVAFLRRLALTHQIGDYLFVHAGVRPQVPIEEQERKDLLWIREPFLGHRGSFGPVVVHGHSVTSAIESQPNRIGLDTGAYTTGVLSAVVLEGSSRRFVDTREG